MLRHRQAQANRSRRSGANDGTPVDEIIDELQTFWSLLKHPNRFHDLTVQSTKAKLGRSVLMVLLGVALASSLWELVTLMGRLGVFPALVENDPTLQRGAWVNPYGMN